MAFSKKWRTPVPIINTTAPDPHEARSSWIHGFIDRWMGQGTQQAVQSVINYTSPFREYRSPYRVLPAEETELNFEKSFDITEANQNTDCISRPKRQKYTGTPSPTSSRSALAERQKRKQAKFQAKKDSAAGAAPPSWPDETAYEKRSLFYFTLKDPIRRAAIFAIEWPKRGSSFWDKKVLFVIMANTMTMAMFDCFDKPSMRACNPAELNTPAGPYGYCNKMGTGKYFPQYLGRDMQDIMGKIFSAYFTVELVVKVVAQGFVLGPKTYLADLANWLDVFIVGAGIFDFMPTDAEGGGGVSSLRALRVLRPLRAVNKFPKLKALVVLIGLCVGKLTTAVGMNAFIFLVFGILGVQLYKGALRGRCYDIVTGEVGEDICTLGPVDWNNFDYYWVMKDMDVTGAKHTGGSFRCAPMEAECLQLGSNPGNESQGFDAIGQAMMTIFEIYTMGWVDLCYKIQDAIGYWNWIFFVAIVMLGPMFCLQLFLVVICNRASQVNAERKQEEERQRIEAEAVETAHKEADKQLFAAVDTDQSGEITLDELHAFMKCKNLNVTAEEVRECFSHMDRDKSGGVDKNEFVRTLAESRARQWASNKVVPDSDDKVAPAGELSVDELRAFMQSGNLEVREKEVQARSARAKQMDQNHDGFVSNGEFLAANGLVGVRIPKKEKPFTRQDLQLKIKAIAVSERLQNLVMAVILLSTSFMALDGLCEYDPAECYLANACLFGGQSCAQYKGTLEFMNLGFTIVFLFELAVKIAGFGPVTFFRGEGSKMNIFDTVIVINSLVEFHGGKAAGTCFFNYFQGAATEVIAQTWPPGSKDFNVRRRVTVQDMFGKDSVLGASAINSMELSPAWKDSLLNIPRVVQGADGTWSYNPMMYLFCSGGGALAVLRALRLVRLVKFLRRFPEIIKQLEILGDAVGSIAALLVLIAIMLFIFTILGMNLLGGSVTADWPPENGIVVGQEVYLTIPWDENGGRPRHGKVHWFDFENNPWAPYKVELEFGGNKGGGGGWDPIINVSVGGVLDEHGYIWAATKDDNSIGVPVITGCIPRFHFDNLGVAFLTAYSIFFQANWNERVYEVMGSGMGIGYVFYFYAIIVIGNWILLNLFIAILIGKFTEQRAAQLEKNLDTMEAEFLKRLSGLEEEELGEELVTFFNEIDVDGSGEVDKVEFNNALLKLGVTLKPQDLDKLMFDATGDKHGKIDFEEFVIMIKRFLAKDEGSDVKMDVSKEIDKSKQRKKEKEEAAVLEDNLEALGDNFLKGLGDLTDEMLNEHLTQLFSELDLDTSGGIDKSEFNQALLNLGVTLNERQLDKMVANVIGDGSAVISVENFIIMIMHFLKDAKEKRAREEEAEQAFTSPKSCFCIHHYHPIRVSAFMLINEDKSAFGGGWKGNLGPYFGHFILTCILVSTVQLAIFTPWVGQDSRMTRMLDIIDIILNLSFTIELLAKYIALGWSAFIKPGWNKLDFFIVSTSDIDMTLTYALKGQDIPLTALRIFRVFRIFRALRPLRIIARAKSIRTLVGCMLAAVKPVSTTMIIVFGIFVVVGIFFIQFLGGRIGLCTDPRVFTRPDCVGLDDDGNPRAWAQPDVHFNNIYYAWMAMFVLATGDDWPTVMWNAADSTGPLTALKQGGTMNAFLGPIFVGCAIIVCMCVVINMFVGVFVDCYYSAQAEVAQDDDKRTPPALNPKILDDVFDDPTAGLRGCIYAVVSETDFDIFIAFFIVANVLSMATDSFKPSDGQVMYDCISNYFFCFVFAWEAGFKMYALSPARYFKSGWSKFDCFIVTISFIGVLIDGTAGIINIDPSILRILRIFRIFRILRAFRIFKAAKDLQNIVLALGRSIGQVMNLLLLLMLLFFIFGVLAVNVGGHMCVEGDEDPPQDILQVHPLLNVRCAITAESAYLQKHAHFQGVGVGLFTMWRVATGDGWGGIMTAVSTVPGPRILSSDLHESYLSVTNSTIDTLDASKVLGGALVDEGYKNDHITAMAIAVIALQKYNSSIYAPGGMLGPENNQARRRNGGGRRKGGGKGGGGDGMIGGAGARWLQLAKFALPTCLTDDEANFLSSHELLDCSNPGDGFSAGKVMCPGTCGFNLAGLFYTSMIARLYFLVFIMISSFVLMQLVIGVLMDQLGQSEDSGAASRTLAPGCEELSATVFLRTYRRFNYNARRKMLCVQTLH